MARTLISQIFDRGKWAIVKRTGALEHADFVNFEDPGIGGNLYV